MDEDLESLTYDELVAEARRLRGAIRTHRDSTGHGLCWHHPQMWALLPDDVAPEVLVPDWPQFLRGCIHYRASLDELLPTAPRSGAEYPG